MIQKKFNVGIVGYGWASQAHLAALNATVHGRVTALCSSRPLDSAELSARHGGPITCYQQLDQLLADPSIDVVDLCSYPHLHARQAIAAARAGKHLIIEKPIALTLADCEAVHEAVRTANVKACVCFECRFSSQFKTIRAVLDAGLLGKIHYGEVDYYLGVGPWCAQYRWNIHKDQGGSSLLSAGCHALDALLFCMGEDVARVSSYTTQSLNPEFSRYEFPTTSVTIVKFADGRVGKVASVIDCLQPYYFHVHLVGSKGSLLDNKFYSTALGGLNKSQWSQLSMSMLDSGDGLDHPYRAMFEAFFRALEQGQDMPHTSLEHALRTHRVIFGADHSAAHHEETWQKK